MTDDSLPSIPFCRFLFETSKWQALSTTANCLLYVPGQLQHKQGWNFIESYARRKLAETMPQQYITFKRNKHELLKMCNGWSMIQWTDE
eukprot:4973092-Alexandrium_andersonii.AAC.1